MEAFLNDAVSNSTLPVLTAFLLGLMTAISPCPLATNITAIGFISKDVDDKHRVFINGLVYTLGRAITYVAIAVVIYAGADQFKLSGWFQQYGEKAIGPLLILIGLFMLGVFRIGFLDTGKITEYFGKKGSKNYGQSLLLGVLFALAFCPYSGVLYFAMLIPITVSSASGLYLPFVFAVATGIPVIVFAWLIAYAVSGVGSLYNNLKTFEQWFRRLIAVLFIGIGVYYTTIMFIIPHI